MPPLTVGTDELPLAGSMSAPARTLYDTRRGPWPLARACRLSLGHGDERPRWAAARGSPGGGLPEDQPALRHRHVHAVDPGAAPDHHRQPLRACRGTARPAARRRRSVTGCWPASTPAAGRPRSCWPERPSLVGASTPRSAGWHLRAFRPLATTGERLADWLRAPGRDPRHLREAVEGIGGGIGWLFNARYRLWRPERDLQGRSLGRIGRDRPGLPGDPGRGLSGHCRGGGGWALPAADVRSIASDHAVIQPAFLRRFGMAAAAAGGLLAAMLW